MSSQCRILPHNQALHATLSWECHAPIRKLPSIFLINHAAPAWLPDPVRSLRFCHAADIARGTATKLVDLHCGGVPELLRCLSPGCTGTWHARHPAHCAALRCRLLLWSHLLHCPELAPNASTPTSAHFRTYWYVSDRLSFHCGAHSSSMLPAFES